MDLDKLKNILTKSRKYVAEANNSAEARHDNPGGEYYMDYGQYEIVEETGQLLKEIDEFLELL